MVGAGEALLGLVGKAASILMAYKLGQDFQMLGGKLVEPWGTERTDVMGRTWVSSGHGNWFLKMYGYPGA
jgi:hypothetical protein